MSDVVAQEGRPAVAQIGGGTARRLAGAAVLVLCLLALCAPAASASTWSVSADEQIAHTLVVGFREGTSSARRAAVLRSVHARVLRHLGERDSVHVRIRGPLAPALRVLRRSPVVEYAERVATTHGTAAAGAAASSAFARQWSLRNVGQFAGSTPGSDVDARGAWTLADGGGKTDVLLASVDSGVALSLPQLSGLHLWSGGAARLDDRDEESASFCVHGRVGCDFVNQDPDPTDDGGHGTATVSMMLGPWGTSPVAGLAPGVSLIVAKVLNAHDGGTTADLAAGLNYVAEQGTSVANVSVAGPPSAAVRDAILDHPGTLFVISAGNDGADVDDGGVDSFPCALDAPNVVCVAASTWSDGLAGFSNRGRASVDLAAPGDRVDALDLRGDLRSWEGTSFAAPLVSATAALALSAVPEATPAQIADALRDGADRLPAFAGTTVSGGRLDSARTLALLAHRPVPVLAHAGRTEIGTVRAAGAGRLRVTVGCRGDGPCTGGLAVAGPGRSGPATRFSVPRLERKTVVVRGARPGPSVRLVLELVGAPDRVVRVVVGGGTRRP